MKTNFTTISVDGLTRGAMSVEDDGHKIPFKFAGNECDFGVTVCNDKLIVRPSYQREFVWDEEKQRNFIYSILKGMTINPLVVSKEGDFYECVDGQQRTITLCRFVYNKLTISYGNTSECKFDNLSVSDKERFKAYKLYVMENTYDSYEEKIEHFRAINQPITILTEQELRNATYSGTFVNALKDKFGRRNCVVEAFSDDGYKSYISSKIRTDRQELTELALVWHLTVTDDEVFSLIETAPNHDINPSKITNKIEDYMEQHRYDEDCDEVWINFQKICSWIYITFNKFMSREMKNVKNWAFLYRKFKNISFDTNKIYNLCSELMNDADIHHKYNIPEYVLIMVSEKKSHSEMMENSKYRAMLSLQNFTDDIKMRVYREQGCKCADCNRKFKDVLNGNHLALDAHHINPWSNGGKTEAANCVILCHECHGKRHNMGWKNPYSEILDD